MVAPSVLLWTFFRLCSGRARVLVVSLAVQNINKLVDDSN